VIAVVVVRERVTTTERAAVAKEATVDIPWRATVAARVACATVAVAEERARPNRPDRRVTVAASCVDAEAARPNALPRLGVVADKRDAVVARVVVVWGVPVTATPIDVVRARVAA